MDTYTELLKRRSTRSFKDEKVDDEIKEKLYEAAFNAPTAGNQQFYSIIEVNDRKIKEVVAGSCDHQMWITKAPLVLIFLADLKRWNELYRAYGLKARRPHLGDLWLALSDANIAAQNMVTAAEHFGLGTCYIGDIIENHEVIRDVLKLKEGLVPACMLVIGYPEKSETGSKPRRFNKEYIVHQDYYHEFDAHEHIRYYKERCVDTSSDLKVGLERFLKRKYLSDFAFEMNRSAAMYFEPYLDDIEVLLVDLDDTIINFEAAEKAALKTLFERFALGYITDEMIEKYSAINARYWQMLERKEKTKDVILVERFKEFFELYGIDSSIAEAFNEAYQTTLGDTIVYNDDSLELMKELKGKVRLYLVSNGTVIAQRKKLKNSGFDKVFDKIYLSEEVGYEKPAKEFFDRVFEDIDVDKRHVMIVGDSITSDMKGGIDYGIKTCHYDPKGLCCSLPVTYSIRDLRELIYLL